MGWVRSPRFKTKVMIVVFKDGTKKDLHYSIASKLIQEGKAKKFDDVKKQPKKKIVDE